MRILTNRHKTRRDGTPMRELATRARNMAADQKARGGLLGRTGGYGAEKKRRMFIQASKGLRQFSHDEQSDQKEALTPRSEQCGNGIEDCADPVLVH